MVIRTQRFRRHAAPSMVIIALLFTFAALSGCSTLDLTPVASPATHKHSPGKILWHDLLTQDVAQAKDFYGQLFGWGFKQQGAYTVVLRDEQAIGGMVEIKPKPNGRGVARWIASLSVSNVDQAAGFVRERGGKIHEGPVYMRHRGRGALISDPQGAQILLLRSATGDPEDKEPAINDWLWDELWSSDPTTSLDFYQTLVGYSSRENRENYWILKMNGKWRAGVRGLFDKKLEQRWVPVIRVSDLQKISGIVTKLGGRVLIKSGTAEEDKQIALLADPSGALFMVQKWPGIATEGGQ